jgi:hypothetical protein
MSVEKGKQEISGWGGARPGAGRKPFVPTDEDRELVEKYAGLGLSQDQIAALIRDGVAKNVLFEYFSKELELGKAKAHAKIGGKLFQKAMDGDTASLIWWTKTQMRWAETQKHEIVQTTISINGALESAKNRVLSADIIDGVARELEAPSIEGVPLEAPRELIDAKKPSGEGLDGEGEIKGSDGP